MFGLGKREFQSILNFTKMNIRDRYMGSTLGSVWAIANPVILLGLYTFVFGFVFKARMPGASTTLEYAVWLISGYGPWLAITEGVVASTQSIVSNSGIVKNIAMKAEVIPISAALTGVVSLVVNFVFLLVLMASTQNFPTWHVLFLVPVVALQFLMIIGLGLFFSAVNVFFRDFGIVLPNLLTMILFATPIFYPLEAMPSALQFLANFNPIFIVADGYRKALIFHQIPNLPAVGLGLVFAFVVFILGLKFFRKLKGNFEAAL